MKKLFKRAAIIVTLVIILVIGVTSAAMAAGPNPDPGTCPNPASNGEGPGVCPNPDCPNADGFFHLEVKVYDSITRTIECYLLILLTTDGKHVVGKYFDSYIAYGLLHCKHCYR